MKALLTAPPLALELPQALMDLASMRRQFGVMPHHQTVWLGLDFKPPKFISFSISTNPLPNKEDFTAIAGLDVIVLYHGRQIGFSILNRLYAHLIASLARRIHIHDLDIGKYAILKTGEI